MRTRPPLVDPQGNINVHELEDLYLPVLPPDGGSLAGRSLTFKLADIDLSVALIDHPSNASAKLIHVTKTQMASLPDHARFALIDTTAGYPRTKWAGTLRRYR